MKRATFDLLSLQTKLTPPNSFARLNSGQMHVALVANVMQLLGSAHDVPRPSICFFTKKYV